MGSSRRYWLNQATHSKAASSTDSLAFQGGPTVNQFRLVRAIDRLSQGVVVAVAAAAYRGLDARLAHNNEVPARLRPVRISSSSS